jgi:hypothetical protein
MVIWIMGLAGWLGTQTRVPTMLASTACTALTFSCSAAKIDGWLRRMEIPSEADTARRGGMDAEKTKEVPLIRWWSTTI